MRVLASGIEDIIRIKAVEHIHRVVLQQIVVGLQLEKLHIEGIYKL